MDFKECLMLRNEIIKNMLQCKPISFPKKERSNESKTIIFDDCLRKINIIWINLVVKVKITFPTKKIFHNFGGDKKKLILPSILYRHIYCAISLILSTQQLYLRQGLQVYKFRYQTLRGCSLFLGVLCVDSRKNSIKFGCPTFYTRLQCRFPEF